MSLVLQEIGHQYIATNNGLEQVYQNRLEEGWDYIKYDWLTNGENNQGFISLSDKEISSADVCGYGRDIIVTTTQNVIVKEYGNQKNVVQLYPYSAKILAYIGDEFSIRPNGLYYYGDSILKNMGTLKTIFKAGYTGHIKSLKADTISLTPCKLLAPCPPNLSANGKPYAQGECGMIDSISGKFYGNSGSGSFSVYNDSTE